MKMKSIGIRSGMVILGAFLLAATTGCSTASNLMNPFYESPSDQAKMGERNDKALNGDQKKEDTARAALQSMATYQRTHLPQPVNPVIQPAVVRLMWVPDHLNRHGDLVPAHYYYLKVLDDRWAVTDAFELESQLNRGRSSDASSNIPFVHEGDRN